MNINTAYHKLAAAKCQEYVAAQTKHINVMKLMESRHREVCENNGKRLRAKAEIVDFCGKNNIARRGTNDSGPIYLKQLERGSWDAGRGWQLRH